jgi:hypothetical protein
VASDDDIKWLMETRQVSRKIAANAYRDAEKAAKARRPKGLAALEAAAKGELLDVRQEALRLLDEPERQPAKPAKATKPRATTPRSAGVVHRLHAVSGRTSRDAVLLADRMRALSKQEQRLRPEERVYDRDRCVVFQAEGTWQRRTRANLFADVWVDGAGRLVVLVENVIHTLEHAGATGSERHVVEGARPRRITGCDAVGELAFDPFDATRRVMWWREAGRGWTELPYPPGIRSPLCARVTPDRIWVVGWGQTVASHDGQRWTEATVDHGEHHEPGDRGIFTQLAVSPEGRVLASRSGTLYEGDGARLGRLVYAGHDEVSSIAWFAGSFWVGHVGRGVCRLDGETLVPVATPAKLHGFDETTEIRLSARDSLLAMSSAELLESTDGVAFRTITTSREIAQVVGSDDVYWAGAR